LAKKKRRKTRSVGRREKFEDKKQCLRDFGKKMTERLWGKKRYGKKPENLDEILKR
jgi:hypothetical protein